MAEPTDDAAAFWLPSDFLSDDDFKEQPRPSHRAEPDPLLAELTRHLAHSMTFNTAARRSSAAGAWVAAGTRAASHQACSGYSTATYDGAPFGRRAPPVHYNASQGNQFQQVSGGACRAASVAAPQSAWPLRCEPQSTRLIRACAGGCYGVRGGGGYLGGSGGVKRQSTGTGVFLPRRVGNSPAPEPRKKQGFSTVLLPARVVHALNLNVQDNPCFLTNHDLLLARRNAMLAQQRRVRRAEGQIGHHEVPLLPQEWTY